VGRGVRWLGSAEWFAVVVGDLPGWLGWDDILYEWAGDKEGWMNGVFIATSSGGGGLYTQ